MIEAIILKHLVQNSEYAQQVLPFIQPRFFEDKIEKAVFTAVAGFVDRYHTLPSADALKLTIQQSSLLDEAVTLAGALIDELFISEPAPPNETWLKSETEKWVQDKSVFHAIYDSLDILDDEADPKSKKKIGRHEIPKILTDALGVSFDVSIGHDLIADAEARYDVSHSVQKRIPFDIELLNRITDGGLRQKTLTVFVASTNVGKSLVMCHVAARAYLQNKSVLYVTFEMDQESIAERNDANLLGVDIADLRELPKSVYLKKIEALRQQAPLGRLIIKEFPTAGAHVGHIRHLLHELHLKKNFVPEIIFIDYLNIMLSSRYSASSQVQSYQMVKSICEELRGLAVEVGVPIVSATQTNREGYGSSDFGLSEVSESTGTSATADNMWALIVTDDHIRRGRMLLKQLKSRHSDVTQYTKFEIGINRRRMLLFDVPQDEGGTSAPPTNEHVPSTFVAGSGATRRAVGKFVPAPSEHPLIDPTTGVILGE